MSQQQQPQQRPEVAVSTITEKKPRFKRLSLQLETAPPQDQKHLRQTQSFSRTITKPVCNVETIPEDSGEELPSRVQRNESDRASQMSKVSKKSSLVKKHYDNTAFEPESGSNSNLKLSPGALERGSASARSSTRTSNTSLQVQQEQYWCFSKWSPCEKRLASCVAILATVILILVIVVGVMAGDHNKGLRDIKMLNPLPL